MNGIRFDQSPEISALNSDLNTGLQYRLHSTPITVCNLQTSGWLEFTGVPRSLNHPIR